LSISYVPWGRINGKPVNLYTLSDDITVQVCNYGGTIVSIKTPDRMGRYDEVVLGFDSLKGYQSTRFYHGATIGRYCNRIAGGEFSIDGVRYSLSLNERVNHLHGGFKGFDKKVWTPEIVGDSSLQLSLRSPDGEEGYPGNLSACVTFTVDGCSLMVEYSATTDKATVVNLTNHAYFNLSGAENILDHQLWINAEYYTPIDSNLIPTGELEPVEGTPFDYNEPTCIRARINDDHPQLRLGKGYDHNYALNPSTHHPQIKVYDLGTGRLLEISTTMPGIQLYTGNFLDGSEYGRLGPIGFRAGLCLETQYYLDSPNKPTFPSPILRPGEKYLERTVYRFTVDDL